MNAQNKTASGPGTLFVVATPIGNLEDISARAIQTLKNADLIACEDTRHSRRLLQAHGIDTLLVSHHQHNEHQSAPELIRKLKSGDNIAIIADAGTPLISDPGFTLVRQAHAEKIPVSPIPGASAAIALLSVSGLPTDSFRFIGFLPAKGSQRRSRLDALKNDESTLVFYESAHRIADSLRDMAAHFGADRTATLGRELTKTFETIRHGRLAELAEFVASNPNQQKGEFVIAVSGQAASPDPRLTSQQKTLARLLSAELPPKKAAKLAASHHNGNARAIYQWLIDQNSTEKARTEAD
jgi:16S rRNA (cytidine1402-2'-O)-methyltransferase